jgi:hypothetical protein
LLNGFNNMKSTLFSNTLLIIANPVLSRYYFQHDINRLSTCTLTIHALLHIPEDIRNCGPVWTYWCFVMERLCGILLRAVKSKLNPWGALAQRAKRISQIQLLNIQYSLWDVLRPFQPLKDDLKRGERCYDNENLCMFLSSFVCMHTRYLRFALSR